MRVFDFIGALAVVGWIVLVGAYVYDLNFATEEALRNEVGSEIVLHEGESWMLLTREETEVGYVHEVRTRLESGWLLEYDLLMNVAMLGVNQVLETRIKATVDEAAILRQFNASIQTASKEFDVTGHVEGNDVVLIFDLGTGKKRDRITLKEPPRLSNSAINQLIARQDLEPGMTFRQEYFDPMMMGMTQMTFEFVRRHELNVFDRVVDAYHFRQKVAGSELDVYVDRNGEVWIQEFPLRIIGARMPDKLGRGRALALRRELEGQRSEAGDFPSALSMKSAVNLLKGVAEPGHSSRYRISNLPPDFDPLLVSGEQRVVHRSGGAIVVDTNEEGERKPLSEEERGPLLQLTERVDGDARAVQELVRDIPEDATNVVKAESIARRVNEAVRFEENTDLDTASRVLEEGVGDSTETSLVLVAALRRLGIPARFVYGVQYTEDTFAPHVWVQYWDENGRFVDIDPTNDTLLLGTNQLQLDVHSESEHPSWPEILDEIVIERLPEAEAPVEIPPELAPPEDSRVDDDEETFAD